MRRGAVERGAAERLGADSRSPGQGADGDGGIGDEGSEAVAPAVRGPGYVAEVVEIIQQVAEAADALHEAGIVHRDIKPGNIMVAPGWEDARADGPGPGPARRRGRGPADADAAVRRHAALRQPGAGPGRHARGPPQRRLQPGRDALGAAHAPPALRRHRSRPRRPS